MRPRVSVVIPVLDGAATLGDCLERVLGSTYTSHEVIVVDDGSTDRSVAVAGRYRVRCHSLGATYGPAEARNRGAALAGGEILFFLDADVLVEPDTVARMVQALDGDPSACAVFCSYRATTLPSNFVSVYKNLLHHYTHRVSRADAATFCAGFGAIRRSEFAAIGGFDPGLRFLEDVDLGYRLHGSGRRIVLDAGIQVVHAKRYSLRSLVHSDVVGRAIPWTRLMLRHRIFRRDLNVRGSNVLSVAVTWLSLCTVALALLAPQLGAAALALLAALVALNLRFLTFLYHERGARFALRAVPMLWLGYLYSGAGAVAGVASYVRHGADR